MFNTEILKYFVSLKYILDVLMSIHTTTEGTLINKKIFILLWERDSPMLEIGTAIDLDHQQIDFLLLCI